MNHPYPTFIRNFQVLAKDQCQDIHFASLEILSSIGFRVYEDQAIRLLQQNGVVVTNDNKAYLQPQLVEWALRNTPSQVILWSRNGQASLRLQSRNVHFGTGSDCPFILDSFSGERRKFLKQDVANGIRLCDALSNIDFVLSMGLISDVPESISDLHQYDAMVRNTVKPVVFTAHHRTNCRSIVEMAEVIAGGPEVLRRRPNLALFTETLPPLQYAEETTQKILYMAEKQLPVVISSGPMMGASGPQTHAGVLALANAEILAGIVLAQLHRRGAPIIYGIGVHPFDMRTTVLPYGAPELSLNTAASVDLARFYNLPVWGYAGCSDAKIVDQQAAMEATTSILMSLLSGNNLVHDVAYLESGLTSSFEMLVLCDLAIEMGRYLLKPVEVNKETLALDVIRQVGPGGHYIQEQHTLDNFREIWYHDLVDHQRYEAWVGAGEETLGERLNAQVEKLLAKHAVSPLSKQVDIRLAQRLVQGEEESATLTAHSSP